METRSQQSTKVVPEVPVDGREESAKKAQDEVCRKDVGDKWDKDDEELWEETEEEAKSVFFFCGGLFRRESWER